MEHSSHECNCTENEGIEDENVRSIIRDPQTSGEEHPKFREQVAQHLEPNCSGTGLSLFFPLMDSYGYGE